MIPVPLYNEPPTLQQCRVLRSRREVSTKDAINSRFVEAWNTDGAQLQYDRRPVNAEAYFLDTLGVASRQYRESLNQWAPYQVPGPQSRELDQTLKFNQILSEQYNEYQAIDTKLGTLTRSKKGSPEEVELRLKLEEIRKKIQETQAVLNSIQTDVLSENPYFNKYDVGSDPRNIIRELRSVVSEDPVDRGVRESKALLSRNFQTRWVPQEETEKKGYDMLNAYELMRPKFNDMTKTYWAPVRESNQNASR